MHSVLAGSEHIERELGREPIKASVAGSLALHAALAAILVFYGALGSLFHHDLWGTEGSGGAMQVSLVSSAIPLPNNQPQNQNVLATETPSQAPAAPSPKEKQAVDDKAIAIASKQAKQQQKQPQQAASKTQQHQPQTRDNVAKYGEQAGSSIARGMPRGGPNNGPAAVGNSDFTSRFGWYVDQINAKMANSWYKQEVDPRTPRGARVFLTFTIQRNGSPSSVQLDRSSGSPTLDRSCQRGVQRVDTFGSLPSAYNQSTLRVSYYCEY